MTFKCSCGPAISCTYPNCKEAPNWQAAIATAPAWKDAPDAPGLWLNGINLQAERVTPHHIEFSSWKNTGAKWYGPIPSEDKP